MVDLAKLAGGQDAAVVSPAKGVQADRSDRRQELPDILYQRQNRALLAAGKDFRAHGVACEMGIKICADVS